MRDFLEEKFVPWHRLLAGGVLLESRPIEHAASLELPIEHFARENDLVLSTIVGCE